LSDQADMSTKVVPWTKTQPRKDELIIGKKVSPNKHRYYNTRTYLLYELNDTAAMILELCDGKRSFAQITTETAKKFRVSPADISNDLERLMDELTKAKLLVNFDDE